MHPPSISLLASCLLKSNFSLKCISQVGYRVTCNYHFVISAISPISAACPPIQHAFRLASLHCTRPHLTAKQDQLQPRITCSRSRRPKISAVILAVSFRREVFKIYVCFRKKGFPLPFPTAKICPPTPCQGVILPDKICVVCKV